MKVCVMIDNLPGNDATSIADALAEIAETLHERGYDDGRSDRCAPCTIGTEHGCRPEFVISQR